MSRVELHLGEATAAVERRLLEWLHERTAQRLWAKEASLFAADDGREVVERLGWLHLPARMRLETERLAGFADDVRSSGVERVVLIGMGGSSLAPELFARTFGGQPGWPTLTVADSTHPDAIAALTTELDPAATLFVVSSKSGTTAETRSLFEHFWTWSAAHPRPEERFVAITDPGSPLEALARQRDLREIFGAPPDVGGRYSALSTFGLVPAALIGVDLERLLESARAAAIACAGLDANRGLELGAILGELALAGRQALTFVVSPALEAFPDWLEQLVAESTGKHGTGIVPVTGEPLAEPGRYRRDRVFVEIALADQSDPGRQAALDALTDAGHPLVRIVLDDRYELGGELFVWEVAVAMAGVVLGVNPFDQPDVELAKRLARRALAEGAGEPPPALEPGAAAAQVAAAIDRHPEGGYLAIQAFLAPSGPTAGALAGLRDRLAIAAGRPTTLGFGPRYLHSTGQLHKGGPGGGLFLQLVDQPLARVPVPGGEHDFAALIAGQAAGDRAALEERGRPLVALDLGDDPAAYLERLTNALVH